MGIEPGLGSWLLVIKPSKNLFESTPRTLSRLRSSSLVLSHSDRWLDRWNEARGSRLGLMMLVEEEEEEEDRVGMRVDDRQQVRR